MSADLFPSPAAEFIGERPSVPGDVLKDRIDAIDWRTMEQTLSADGHAATPVLLTAAQCLAAVDLYTHEERFRSRIVMQYSAFGRAEYQYFRYPLPTMVSQLRDSLYSHLAPIANRWHAAMCICERFPAHLREFTELCHSAGQHRPTPLMLKYGPQDYCRLHQNLHGEHVFPFQAIFLLSTTGMNFSGGELLLTERDRKRACSSPILPLVQGQAVVFSTKNQTLKYAGSADRTNAHPDVSRLLTRHGYTMGIIFHDTR